MATVFDELREAETVHEAVTAARKAWPECPPLLIMIAVSLYTIWHISTVERHLYRAGMVRWEEGEHVWNR